MNKGKRGRDSIAVSVRIALRQSHPHGLSGDELAQKLNLRGSMDLISVIADLKQDGWLEECKGRFFICSPRKSLKQN
jgi:hypothetical protein